MALQGNPSSYHEVPISHFIALLEKVACKRQAFVCRDRSYASHEDEE